MKAHLQYLSYVLRHKWFVLVECWKMGLFWRGLVHDLSKFTPAEWFPYVRYFYGPKVEVKNTKVYDQAIDKWTPLMEAPDSVKREFDVAWLHHQKRNSHHWQYWLLTPDNPRPEYNFQSHDGGASHVTIQEIKTGKMAAIAYDCYWKWPVDYEAGKRLDIALQFTPVALEMPVKDRAEMLCDWIGAGRALGKPDTLAWYNANKDKMRLHPETRAWIEWKLRYPTPTNPELVYAIEHREFIRMSAGVVGGSNSYDYP
jgi:hypothetical protein